ncbi:MAG: sialate O-acetylesterase [Pseudomonadota bacterium]
MLSTQIRLVLTWTIASAFCALGWQHAIADETGATYRVYYLGGQSNMDGYGFVSELPADLGLDTEDVMIFTGQPAFDNETHGGVGVWQGLRPGFGTGFKSDGENNQLSDRFGPELLFGDVMGKSVDGTRIAIIKYALGGSGLANGVGYGNWHPEFDEGDGINQYDNALKTIRNAFAVSDIDGDGRADRLVPSGIIWMQGEADAYDSQASADAYEANLTRMMNLLRAALRVDDLPVVIGKITDSGMSEDGTVMDYIGTVQAAQKAFVDSDACAAYVTVTDNLGYIEDGWHYDSDGFVRMGTAFAKAMVTLQTQCGFNEV